MAQTKRKRRNKHRGNAVGAVEARGRTSKPREEAGKSRSRGGGSARAGAGARALKPPTLQAAAIKAGFGVAILFIFFKLTSKDVATSQALYMCLIAFVLYTPLMYLTDKWIYARKLKQQEGGRAR
jgi:hypothetical protein